jgi:hypothetical protein
MYVVYPCHGVYAAVVLQGRSLGTGLGDSQPRQAARRRREGKPRTPTSISDVQGSLALGIRG